MKTPCLGAFTLLASLFLLLPSHDIIGIRGDNAGFPAQTPPVPHSAIPALSGRHSPGGEAHLTFVRGGGHGGGGGGHAAVVARGGAVGRGTAAARGHGVRGFSGRGGVSGEAPAATRTFNTRSFVGDDRGGNGSVMTAERTFTGSSTGRMTTPQFSSVPAGSVRTGSTGSFIFGTLPNTTASTAAAVLPTTSTTAGVASSSLPTTTTVTAVTRTASGLGGVQSAGTFPPTGSIPGTGNFVGPGGISYPVSLSPLQILNQPSRGSLSPGLVGGVVLVDNNGNVMAVQPSAATATTGLVLGTAGQNIVIPLPPLVPVGSTTTFGNSSTATATTTTAAGTVTVAPTRTILNANTATFTGLGGVQSAGTFPPTGSIPGTGNFVGPGGISYPASLTPFQILNQPSRGSLSPGLVGGAILVDNNGNVVAVPTGTIASTGTVPAVSTVGNSVTTTQFAFSRTPTSSQVVLAPATTATGTGGLTANLVVGSNGTVFSVSNGQATALPLTAVPLNTASFGFGGGGSGGASGTVATGDAMGDSTSSAAQAREDLIRRRQAILDRYTLNPSGSESSSSYGENGTRSENRFSGSASRSGNGRFTLNPGKYSLNGGTKFHLSD